MAKTVEAQCGYCRKRFRLRPNQLDRQVRCPHCKTVVRIHGRTETAEEAVRALKAEGGPPSGPVASQRPGATSQAAVRSRSLAIVWAALLAVALGAVIVGLVVVFRDDGGPGKAAGAGGGTVSAGDAAVGGAVGGSVGDGSVGDGSVGNGSVGEGAVGGGAVDLPDAAGSASSGGQPWQPDTAPMTADIKRVLRGYADETVTYAVGHVTNNTKEMIPSIRIVVSLRVSEGGEKVGDATAVILNLPPKHTAPIVAECRHEAGVRAKYWMLSTWEMNPGGVPSDLPPLEARNAVPVGDPNSVEPTGLVRAMVTNHGKVAVKDILMSALLLDEKGRIVGAARHRASRKIEPDATEEVEIEWRHTAGTLVRNVEVWVQPHFYQKK